MTNSPSAPSTQSICIEQMLFSFFFFFHRNLKWWNYKLWLWWWWKIRDRGLNNNNGKIKMMTNKVCNVALNDGQFTIKMFFFEIYEWFAFTSFFMIIINRCRFGYANIYIIIIITIIMKFSQYLRQCITFSLIKATEKVLINRFKI